MCTTSMVMQWGWERWPTPQVFPPTEYPAYMELLRKAGEYDKLMQQPDCPDPAKAAWQKAVEDFMREKYGLEPKA